ncbi:DUF2125 domain-containing protein [Loktanella salsilacus]|uniref:DUF2125 domain-containing protein n=1 Tax=Loktanella salsilacus TaxID=195913 RepID=UPI003736BE5C
MKQLLFIVLALSAIYAGVWFIAARGLDRGLQAGLDAATTQGWAIETESLKTGGFPSRFDVTARNLSVTSPDGGLTWQTPWVQTAALSYRPNKVIATFAPQHTLKIGHQSLAVTSDSLRANVDVAANTVLSFDSMTAEGQHLTLTSDTGWSVQTARTLVALRKLAPQANTYETYINLTDAAIQPALQIYPTGSAQVVMDATLTLDRPIDRMAFMPARPLITNAMLNSIEATWGDIRLTGSGSVTVDTAGRPTGRIDLKAQGWLTAVDLLANLGVIAPGSVQTIKTFVGMLATDGTVTLPLTFANGAMALGPVPLGPAPILRLP